MASPAAGQCEQWWGAPSSARLDSPLAFASYGGALIAGGSFTHVGGSTLTGPLVIWDEAATAWAPLGGVPLTGPLGFPTVSALAQHGGSLFVGGTLDALPGGSPNIVRWDGAAFHPVSGLLNGPVFAMASYGGALAVGGGFSGSVGTPGTQVIALWDGTSWSGLGGGLHGEFGQIPAVHALAVYQGELVAAGRFSGAGARASQGGVPVSNIAAWDGASWRSLGGGLGVAGDQGSLVVALAVYGGELYAAGRFAAAGGQPANQIARWNGASWSAVGSGPANAAGSPGIARTLGVHGAELVLGGGFASVSGVAASNEARWNGAAWAPIGAGVDSSVVSVGSHDGELILGGGFSLAGGRAAARWARWTAAASADFDGSGGAPDVPDLFAFLAAFFARDPAADLDGGFGPTPSDLFAFLNLWFAGCA